MANFWTRLKLLGRLLRMLHRMAAPRRLVFYAAGVFSALVAAAETGTMLVAIPLLSGLAGGSQSDLPPLLREAGRWFKEVSGNEPLLVGLLLLGVTTILRQIFVGIGRTCSFWASGAIVTHIRIRIIENLLGARFAALDRLETGTPRQIVSKEAASVISALRAAFDLGSATLAVAVLGGLMLSVSPRLALLTLLFALAALPAKLHLARRMHRASARNVSASMALMNTLNDAMVGLRVLKLTNRQREFLARIGRHAEQSETAYWQAMLLSIWEPLGTQVAALLLVLGLLAATSATDLLPRAEVMAFLLLLYRTVPFASAASTAFNVLIAALPSTQETYRFFAFPPRQLERQAGATLPPEPIRRIRFEGIGLRYDRRRRALDDVSLEVRRGEVVAFVGASGSGKSSLMHLLLGMYDPTEGRILIDDLDLTAVDLASLRSRVGLVAQDIHLFAGTVLDAIRGGNPRIGREEAIEAARKAEADGFIRALPEGYDTPLGERGFTFSGGQRQRLMIAQILAHAKDVLVLDEATSALDSLNEAAIVDNVLSDRDRITLIVTHRLGRLRDVDRIYVLDDGRICESGRWDELLARRGALWRMHVETPPEPASAPLPL